MATNTYWFQNVGVLHNEGRAQTETITLQCSVLHLKVTTVTTMKKVTAGMYNDESSIGNLSDTIQNFKLEKTIN